MISAFQFSVQVRRFVDEDRLPHLLFYGPPGTGKTSTILAVARQIYSAKEFNSMVLEVNFQHPEFGENKCQCTCKILSYI